MSIEFTAAEESQLRELTNAAFDARNGDPDVYAQKIEAIVDWYQSLSGRALTLRMMGGEKFRQQLVEEALATANPATCLDCSVDTQIAGEYYMLVDEVWLQANPARDGMLCVGCVEERLGRLLTREDFTDCPLNDLTSTEYSEGRSDRLINRLSPSDD